MKVYLFACIEKNIGDDLFIKILCERYPNVQFIISSKAKYGSLEKLPNLIFSDTLEKWNWASSLGQNNRIKALIAKIIQIYYMLRLPKCDIGVSIVGNAFKNTEYTGWGQSRWIRERINLVKEFYLISTNFGPYNDNKWKKDFEKIFPKMKDVCFRDQYSYNLFQNYKNIRFAPDAVISMGNQAPLIHNSKNVIISLIDCSFHARGDVLKQSVYTYEQKMCELIKRLLVLGCKVTLLNSNTEQDRPACERIMKKCASDEITIVNYDGNLDIVMQLYKNSDYVIATRLHTIVLAWLYKLPVLPIVYDIKVDNLLNACNFTEKKYMINKLEEVSWDNIIDELNKYEYTLSDEIIEMSHMQFRELDKKFLN